MAMVIIRDQSDTDQEEQEQEEETGDCGGIWSIGGCK